MCSGGWGGAYVYACVVGEGGIRVCVCVGGEGGIVYLCVGGAGELEGGGRGKRGGRGGTRATCMPGTGPPACPSE